MPAVRVPAIASEVVSPYPEGNTGETPVRHDMGMDSPKVLADPATVPASEATSGPAADPFAEQPLAGFVVAITADRRREEFATLLERRGARVVTVPTMRIEPLDDDSPVRLATEACLAGPLDYVVASTGIGWRGWFSAAEGWGLDQRLLAACRDAIVLTRGPKATGAVRTCGLREGYSSTNEGMRDILDWLLARDLTGTRIAVQRHGTPDPDFLSALENAGAEVIDVPIYRWGPPADPAAVDRLVESIAQREVHAVAFTSAPGAIALLEAADELGLNRKVCEAFGAPAPDSGTSRQASQGTTVFAACVGGICASAFNGTGVPTHCPARGRLGSLVKLIADELPARLRQTVRTPVGQFSLQGHAFAFNGGITMLAPQPAAVLRELVLADDRVVSRADLLRRIWGHRIDTAAGGDHVLDVTVGRLRAALARHPGAPDKLIRTVPKRGYRLPRS